MSEHVHEHEQEDGREPEPTEEEARQDAERLVRKRLALAQVRQYGDPVLRMRAAEVASFDEELARTADRMTSLMHDAEGVGLAATQVGILRRLFVFSDGSDDHAVVNPVITSRSGPEEADEEGCLSLSTVRVPVERQLTVTLEGKDPAGKDVRFELEGLPARVVQHEVDHLDGVLILDRTDAESRKEALAQLRPRLLIGSR